MIEENQLLLLLNGILVYIGDNLRALTFIIFQDPCTSISPRARIVAL